MSIKAAHTNIMLTQETYPIINCTELTLLFDKMLKEALLIVSLRDNIDQQIVLLPKPVNLIVLILDDSSFAMPGDALLHVLLLRDVFPVCVRESCP